LLASTTADVARELTQVFARERHKTNMTISVALSHEFTERESVFGIRSRGRHGEPIERSWLAPVLAEISNIAQNAHSLLVHLSKTLLLPFRGSRVLLSVSRRMN
jgi:hypothetical protein